MSNIGVTAEDYYVAIGVGECKIISMTSEQITCQPPDTLPHATTDVYRQDPDNVDSRLPGVTVNKVLTSSQLHNRIQGFYHRFYITVIFNLKVSQYSFILTGQGWQY